MSYTPSVTDTARYATIDIAGQRFTYPVSSATINSVATPIKGNNGVKYSNDISNAAWTKIRSSAGATVDVTLTDGSVVTLTKLVEDGTASSDHYVEQQAVPGDPSKSAVVRLLALYNGTRPRIVVFVFGDTTSNYYYSVLNVSTGAVESSTNGGTGLRSNTTIEAVGTDGAYTIYEITITGVPTTTPDVDFNRIRVQLDNGTTGSYNGDSTSSVYLGRIQINEGTEATTYNQTTTERIGGDGQRVTYSGDLSNAAWTKVRSSISGTTHNATLTTGETLVMQKLVQDGTATNTHEVLQNSDISALVQSIFKVKVKVADAGFPHCRFAIYNSAVGADLIRANINMSTGVLSSITVGGTGSSVSASAVLLGDGVYEVQITGIPSTTAGFAQVKILLLNADGSTGVFSGDSASGAYIAEPIIVAGTTAPSYIRSYGERLARGGSTRARAYVLLPHVEEFDAAGTHIATKWETDVNWAITDGTSTALELNQFAPPVDAAFGVSGASGLVYPPTGATAGMDAYVHFATGAGTPLPSTFNAIPSETSDVWFMAFDDVSGEWLAKRTEAGLTASVAETQGIVTSIWRSVSQSIVRTLTYVNQAR